MKFLLDTHILLWVSQDSKLLSKYAKSLVTNGDNDVYFSTASIWEIMIKKNTGKFKIDVAEFMRDISDMNIFELPIKIEHVLTLETLPNHHKDPFDRILVAQSLTEPLKLLTHDKILQQYSTDLIEYV